MEMYLNFCAKNNVRISSLLIVIFGANIQILRSFWTPKTCSQTVLPDGSILLRRILAKISKFKWDIFGDFYTMWIEVDKYYLPFYISRNFGKYFSVDDDMPIKEI